MVLFQPGDTSAELKIPILDDSLEWRELKTTLQLSAFLLHLYLGVSAGSVDSATVSNLDDDNVTVPFSMYSKSIKCLRVLVR